MILIIFKDAVLGIRDISLKYPSVLERNLGSICGRLSEIILDGNSNVRQALYVTLNALLPKLKEELLSPFFSLFINYMMAGVTHLSSNIRFDSLQIIILWLRHHSNLVVQHHYKFLPQFISLISQNESTSKSATFKISKQSSHSNRKSKSSDALKSKHTLIECLNILLQRIIKNAKSQEIYSMNIDYQWKQNTNILLFTGLQPSYTLDSILGSFSQNIKTSNQEELYNLFNESNFGYFISQLYPSLIGLIIECELDSLTDNILPHLKNLFTIIYNLVLKLNEINSQDIYIVKNNLLVELAKYVMPYFPLDPQATWSDESKTLLTKLNIIIAKTMTLFLDNTDNESDWIKTIIEYTIYTFPLHQYKFGVHLLSVIKRLLVSINNPKCEIFLEYLTDFNEQSLTTSAAKRKCLNLIYELLMSPHINMPKHILERWLLSFPTTLISLEVNNIPFTNEVLTMISNLCVHLKYAHDYTHDILQSTLYKFFCDVDENQSLGPFIKLPIVSQRLAIEVLAQLNVFSQSMVESIIKCINSSELNSEVTKYLLESLNEYQFGENIKIFKESIKIDL